jgi:hypothetical protein
MGISHTWRDVLPVHPAADLFPLMSEAELRELGEDIKKNGLQIPIVVWISERDSDHPRRRKQPNRYSLLDGRNRLDAMELVGIPFELSWSEEYACWFLDSDRTRASFTGFYGRTMVATAYSS